MTTTDTLPYGLAIGRVGRLGGQLVKRGYQRQVGAPGLDAGFGRSRSLTFQGLIIRDLAGRSMGQLRRRGRLDRCRLSSLLNADELGLEKTADPDLEHFLFEFQTTGAKLAGALGPTARDQACSDPAFTVAWLKRALDHLHKSQAGLEAVAPKKLLPEAMVSEARKELLEIREAILQLMDRFRGRT